MSWAGVGTGSVGQQGAFGSYYTLAYPGYQPDDVGDRAHWVFVEDWNDLQEELVSKQIYVVSHSVFMGIK